MCYQAFVYVYRMAIRYHEIHARNVHGGSQSKISLSFSSCSPGKKFLIKDHPWGGMMYRQDDLHIHTLMLYIGLIERCIQDQGNKASSAGSLKEWNDIRKWLYA
jgi:hypothetical protein